MNVAWMLPSPAWPQEQASSPCRSPIRIVSSTASARRSTGTAMSSESLPARAELTTRPTPSRQRHSAAGPPASARRRARPAASASASASRSAAPLSDSLITRKPAPSGTPPGNPAPATASVAPSRYSIAAGTGPAAIRRCTASRAVVGAGVERGDGQRVGRRRDQPQPDRRDHAERPLRADQQRAQVVAGDVLAHRARRSARARRGAITASMPVTQAPVTPYLKQCGPPAFVATLPPICELSAAPGSGG